MCAQLIFLRGNFAMKKKLNILIGFLVFWFRSPSRVETESEKKNIFDAVVFEVLGGKSLRENAK
jgi:hypothetical protein